MKSTSFPTLSKKSGKWTKDQVARAHTATKLHACRDELIEWLTVNGAQVLDPTNEWEYLRFRTLLGVSIVYIKKGGGVTLTGEADKALQAFFYKTHWSALAATKRKTTPPADKELLVKRDGPNCVLCGHPMGEDVTVEHWVALSQGGPDTLANKALMHFDCNSRLGNLSVSEKIKLRDDIRTKERLYEDRSYSRYLDDSSGPGSLRSEP